MTNDTQNTTGAIPRGGGDPHTIVRRPDAKPGEPQVEVVAQRPFADAAPDAAPPARIEHTAGGVTTRDDPTDMGVPMLPADPDAPPRIGPEDALDPGFKRGDYRGRV